VELARVARAGQPVEREPDLAQPHAPPGWQRCPGWHFVVPHVHLPEKASHVPGLPALQTQLLLHMQFELWHTNPGGQLRPQAPQFDASWVISVHPG
jgi:hypothetical protein